MLRRVVAQARVFEAVAEPNRRRILELLRRGPMQVGELVARVGLSQPATSKHLRVLRDSELVRARVEGPRRVYELRPEGLEAIDVWLAPYRRLWASSLDRLERELDERKERKR